MKFNWGVKILLVYLTFVVGMVALVFISSMQNRDLVSENYYEDELAYQNTINQSHNTSNLSSKIEVKKFNNYIQVLLPKEFSGSETIYNWMLYFAADKTKDTKGLTTSNDGKAFIKLNDKIHGTYILKLNIKNGVKEYYFEKSIVL